MNFCRFLAGCVFAVTCLTCNAGGVAPPPVSKSFGVANMVQGDTTTLTFFIGNNSNGSLTGVAITDVLPQGLVIATPNGLSNSCGGSLVATAGSNSLQLTGGTISVDGSCTFRVNVTAVGLNQQNNVSGPVSSIESGQGGVATASVFIFAAPVPQLTTSKSFAPATIAAGGTSTLTISLKNNDDEFDANGIDFEDDFPVGMTIAPGPQTNTCGGVLTVLPDGIELLGGSLKFSGLCSIRVPVTAAAAGTLINTTSSVACSSELPCSGRPATATLIVTGNTPPPNVPPVITSGPPPPGTVGVFYNYPITATGSPTPTFSATGLPPGMSYSPPGNLIIGTPTQEGTFAATITAANGAQPDAVANYAIKIVNPIAITIPEGGNALPGGTKGKPYGPVPFTSTGGLPPETWSACGLPLPPGLNLSSSGVLAGTPTQTGAFTFDVCVTDSRGTPKKQPFTVVVVSVTTAMTLTVSPNPADAGVPVVVTAQVSGSTTAATGVVQFWVAGTGTRCPSPFVAGVPTDPESTLRSATLDSNGRARLTYTNLRIDDYWVCAKYAGDALYQPANAGPVSLSVIKGLLLPPPAVTLSVPASVVPAAMLSARIVVTGSDGSPIPQGVVRVRVAENEIATASLANGGAVITVRMPESGSVRFTADYAGDANYPPASSADATVQVDNGFAVPSGVPIPTLSQWVLAMMALIVSLFGWRRLRRVR